MMHGQKNIKIQKLICQNTQETTELYSSYFSNKKCH